MRRFPDGDDETGAAFVAGDDGWHVVVPVKEPARAKTRLEPALGGHRAELALAFARDTIDAALACAAIASVTVVTRDPRSAAAFLSAGARVLDERGAGPGGLNHAIAYAAGKVPATKKVAVLLGDLPSLTATQLSTALERAHDHVTAFVADTSGIGTTLLTANQGARLRPRFGHASASAHEKSGATRLSGEGLAGLRRDVDSLGDLLEAERLGLGPRTRELLLGLELPALVAGRAAR